MNQHARIQWDLAMIEAQSLKLGYSWLKQQPIKLMRSSFTEALDEAIADAKQRGGRREGSGRKRLDNEYETVVTSIRLSEQQKAAFEMLGGKQWLRQYLDSVIGIKNKAEK